MCLSIQNLQKKNKSSHILPKSGSLFLNIKVELNDITHSLSLTALTTSDQLLPTNNHLSLLAQRQRCAGFS